MAVYFLVQCPYVMQPSYEIIIIFVRVNAATRDWTEGEEKKATARAVINATALALTNNAAPPPTRSSCPATQS